MKNSHTIDKEDNMNVPGIIYASDKLYRFIKNDKVIEQVKNVAKLPGIINASIALPDAHQGYGFPIGGVAAFNLKNGVVSPGGVGYDINCGVRMLKTNLKKDDIISVKEKLLEDLHQSIPSGVGKGSPFQITYKQLDELLEKGSKWLLKKGYATKEDIQNTEDSGSLKGDSKFVSEKAKKRGIGQIGTLGAGNHFLEVQVVEDIFDKDIAKVFGLSKDDIVIMIHCGSRGLGHQVASDYIKKIEDEYGVEAFPDRELVNAPIKSKLGKEYLSAMNCAANFAFANRQIITFWTRKCFSSFFPDSKIDLLYDVCHNIAKIENHVVNGKKSKICVHRKGATRSFGPSRVEIPEKYKNIGQPVLLPGSMGTNSYLLIGTKKAEELTFGSTAHGSGRVMSRTKAIKSLKPERIKKDIEKSGTYIMSDNIKSFSEEAPEVYKDVEEVVKTVTEIGLNKKIAKLKPLLVIKG